MKRATFCLVAILVLCFARSAVADDSPKSLSRDMHDPERLLAYGRANDAIGALHQRISENEKDAAAWHLLSRAYLAEEQWDKAVEAGEKAVALSPDSSEYHDWLGRAYGERADHVIFVTAIRLAKKTRAEFERAVALQPDNVAAQSDLGEFLLEAPGFLGGGPEKAQRIQQQLVKLDVPSSHWLQARIYEKQSRFDEAEREYRAAIDATTTHKAQYWLNLASFLRRRNRLDDMEAAIQQAVAASNHADGVLLRAAELLVRTNRNFNSAAKWLRQYLNASESIETDPTFRAHYVLGSLLEKQGDRGSAAAEYRTALQLASGYAPAHDALKRVEQ